MQYSSSVTGTSRRRNVPVELVVIGTVVVLGALFANGRAPSSQKAASPAEGGERSVETAYPATEEAGADVTASATASKSGNAAAVGKRPAAVTMPAGVPEGMPVLDGATLVSASADDGAGEYVLTWVVPAEASASAKAYAGRLESRGWSVTSSDDNPGSTVLVFERPVQKGGGRGWVAFIGDAPDVSATLTLSLAR